MWNLIKMIKRTLFKKNNNKDKLTDFKTNLMVTTGETTGGGKNWSVGITYTHRYIKQMVNGALLHSTRKCT